MTTIQKAHGMDGTLVEPDWPPLTLPEVRTLLGDFPGLGEPIEILSVSPRPFSAASVVRAGGGRVFIKRHHRQVRDREGLLEEHRFIEHLRAHGASSPRVLANSCGETAIEAGQWTYEVHEAAEGVDLYKDAHSWTPFRSARHAFSAGQSLAQLHLASRGFTASPRKPRPLVASFTIFAASNPQAALESYLAARPALAEHRPSREAGLAALDLLAPFHAELQPLKGALEPLWTHNDLHASNLLWNSTGHDAQARAIIDFGLADRTNVVHDLAHAIERNMVEWLSLTGAGARQEAVPMHLEDLQAMLAGYELVRPLSGEEVASLAPMTVLCHAEFALSEANYFLGALHSEEKAHLALFHYLVGHARWFSSRGGTKLLDSLRRWADARQDQSASVGKQ
jgi:Ser/Thr protein kinase RdoA (MazF antagonist)